MKIASIYVDLDLGFADKLGTPLNRRNLTRGHFKPMLKKAELKDISLYDLRHTTASLLFYAVENLEVV